MIKEIKAEALKKGHVLALPFSKTATVQNKPTVGRQFVSFKTEHGPSRIEKGSPVLIEEAQYDQA